jgi:hypothetical protein
VNFSEQPRSQQWAPVTYRGERLADVWFKPEGEPFVLVFRIPQTIFQIPGMWLQLTTENLLKAVAIAPEEVESWGHGDVSHFGMNGSNLELGKSLPLPPQNFAYLDIYVLLRPPSEAAAYQENSEPAILSKTWQELEVLWKAILSLEATLDHLRVSMEGLLVEMEASLTKTMSVEEKDHALRSDIAQWNKAKSRVRFALPKIREVIHRCIWALGSPERKRLEELYKNHIQPHIPFPQMYELLKQLEGLQKDRQVLSAQGLTVSQESKCIAAEVQGALRILQANAVAIGRKKKGGGGGKFFKQVRRLSGAD